MYNNQVMYTHFVFVIHGVPDFQCLTVERLCDSVTGNWPVVLSVSPVHKIINMSPKCLIHNYTAVATFSCDSRQAFLLSASNLTCSYSNWCSNISCRWMQSTRTTIYMKQVAVHVRQAHNTQLCVYFHVMLWCMSWKDVTRDVRLWVWSLLKS